MLACSGAGAGAGAEGAASRNADPEPNDEKGLELLWAAPGEAEDIRGEVPLDPTAAGEAVAEDATPESTDRKQEWLVAPIPLSNPTLGTGLGLVAGIIVPLNKQDRISPPSVAGVAGFYTDRGSWAAAVATKLHINEDRYRVTAAIGGFDLNYDFFGIGNEAGDRDRFVEVDQDGVAWSLEGLRRIRENLYGGLRIRWLDTTAAFSEPPVGLPPGEQLPPEFDVTTAAVGLRLLYDRRDSQFNPTEGPAVDFRAERWREPGDGLTIFSRISRFSE